MLKSSVIIDEAPTIYQRADNLIATGRSNKAAVCLGFQDFSQLVRTMAIKKQSRDEYCWKYLLRSGGGRTAKTLSERFGKVAKKTAVYSINRQDVSTSINTQMDALIPPSKISDGRRQSRFGVHRLNERIEQKIFHCEIVVMPRR